MASGWCDACEGAGHTPDAADPFARPVCCPDCAGSGLAEHSITANDASPPSAPEAQGGGEVVYQAKDETLGAWYDVAKARWDNYDSHLRRAVYTAPPSAPVGVDKETERRLIDVAASMLNDNNGKIGKKHFRADATAVVRRVLKALAQQPAAAGELAELVGLLDEVRSHFTRDDDLPDDLLPRIDAALAGQQGGVE